MATSEEDGRDATRTASPFCFRQRGGSSGRMGGMVVALRHWALLTVAIPLACIPIACINLLKEEGDRFLLRPVVDLRTPMDSRFPGPSIDANNTEPSTKSGHISDLDVPSCARDVFVTLHREKGDNTTCQGLLIRDDIILTSSKCSTFNFTFFFPGVGLLQAVPHDFLSSNVKVIDPRLGFLQANPPYHYQFIDNPVRRNRAFLSLRTTDDDGTAVAMSCSRGGRPTARNFPVDGELVPLGHLHTSMPYVLWEHTDIVLAHKHMSAPKLKNDSERWWTRRLTLEEEEKLMLTLFEKYKGPPGSISIVTAHSDYMEQASAVCEAEDPSGHRRGCFPNYYYRYREEEPFSGESFFDWLDFGRGKHIMEKRGHHHRLRGYRGGHGNFSHMKRDEKCLKTDFNQKRVHYFKDWERLEHEIDITPSDNGKDLIARYKKGGEIVPKSEEDNPHLYMWALDNKMYVVDDSWDERQFGRIKHTAVLASQPALSAGKMYVGDNGAIWGINFSSGHYRPEIAALGLMYQWMKNQGFNLTALHWAGRTGWDQKDCEKDDCCDEYDWSTIQIPGYADADALQRSCQEATLSPTWILKEDI